QNPLDPPPVSDRFQLRAQQALAVGGDRAIVAPQFVGVRGPQLPLHLPHQVAELGPRADPVDQRKVALPHLFPVDPGHVLVPEVIPLEAPGFVEHLPPLPTGVHFRPDAVQVDPSSGPARFTRPGFVVPPPARHHAKPAVDATRQHGALVVHPHTMHAIGDDLDLLGVEIPRLQAAPPFPLAGDSAPRTGNESVKARVLVATTGPYRPDGGGNATTRSEIPSRSISTGSAASSSFFSSPAFSEPVSPLVEFASRTGAPGALSVRWAGSKGEGTSARR